jgi:hypothetical protein
VKSFRKMRRSNPSAWRVAAAEKSQRLLVITTRSSRSGPATAKAAARGIGSALLVRNCFR